MFKSIRVGESREMVDEWFPKKIVASTTKFCSKIEFALCSAKCIIEFALPSAKIKETFDASMIYPLLRFFSGSGMRSGSTSKIA